MKKLIKLMFPKTYQAISDEGYGLGRYDENAEWMFANDNYVYESNEFIRESEQAMYEQMCDNEYLELERLHNEHYERIAEDEYQLELTRLHEEDCQEDQKELIKLYTPKEPLLSVGDKIHLHSKQGMYTVTKVFEYSFAYCTQYSEDSYAHYSDYKCHAGGKWNRKKN
jgi:hypothetical protein